MRTVVVLFTRDLRTTDNPALEAACRHSDRVVPLFVADPALDVPANRRRFLTESLADLRDRLRALGGDLAVRVGDPVEETMRMCRRHEATGVAMTDDHSGYARRRHERLAAACESARIPLRAFPGATVVPPGDVRPTGGGDHYRVFTPYWRAWSSVTWRDVAAEPDRVRLPDGFAGDDPVAVLGHTSPESPRQRTGGETEALRRWDDWVPGSADYADRHDDLAGDRTSRMSAYLHFGCVSARMLAGDDRSPEALVRQLCWRDFFQQVLAAFPRLNRDDYRPRPGDWNDDPDELDAWRHGETGVPIVDAGMRQLLAEGWMHNRARMITASYLTKDLRIDWREGAHWFDRWLIDADVANNYGNWQWMAGTGNDSRPNRKLGMRRQTERFDPGHEYIDRWTGSGPV
ncbi:deoxyribodipyrimidine photo-lyase [Stackebrandtia albiflava]|uniref:Deoxyribodipyrimidine photo-lyase n=1 Tax=Stackebrandtia albiflava TaxID=406432 RepID=A0A562UPL9_9ACTN|nr:deoxyribodipyrimidine photo-lyase [Stackebrandtia albiflava]TWJ07565.1 deoxyribodipyrimidine photo-lyase [Stackebrandtia albiflava]